MGGKAGAAGGAGGKAPGQVAKAKRRYSPQEKFLGGKRMRQEYALRMKRNKPATRPA